MTNSAEERARRWTPEAIAELEKRRAEGVSLQALGDEYGISRQMIWILLRRETQYLLATERRRKARLLAKTQKLAELLEESAKLAKTDA